MPKCFGVGECVPKMVGRSFLVGGTAVGERRQVNHTTRPRLQGGRGLVSVMCNFPLLPAAGKPFV